MTQSDPTEPEEGYTLIEAIKQFGPPEIVKRIDNRKQVEDFEAAFGAVPEPDSWRKLIDWFAWVTGALLKAKLAQIIGLRSAKISGYRVFDDLRVGRLVASGIDTEKQPDIREIIPASFWPGQPHLVENCFSSHGRSFASILVVKSDEVPATWAPMQATETAEPPPIVKSKQGRPSKRDSISAAYEQIIKNYDLSFADHIAAIRFTAKQILGDDSDKGLSDDVISKALSKRFAMEKEAAKLTAKR